MRQTLTRGGIFTIGIALLFAACGGGGDESAGDAFKRQMGFVDKGQWSRSYDELHPEQQKLISREAFLSCGAKRSSAQILEVKILETYPEDYLILGTGITAPSTAVTASLKVKSGSQEQEVKRTVHEFKIDGKWRWVDDPAYYANGKCGGS